jgi:hypothetical protein
MATKVGVGKSNNLDPFEAGSEAARIALDRAGVEKCDFVLVFSTIDYDQKEMLRGVRSVTCDTPLSGCSGAGIITQDGPEGEVVFLLSGPKQDKDTVGIMVFSSDEITFHNFVESGLKEKSFNAGEEIGKIINKHRVDDTLLLLMFPDPFTTNIKQLFSGIDTTRECPLPYCGGFAAHNKTFSLITYQYHNDKVLKDSIPCVLISGKVHMEIGVNHGCIPIGIEKTVTKAKDNTVYEIDHNPAWKFYQEYLGYESDQLSIESSPTVSIGVRLPDELSTEYDKYIVYSPLQSNPDGSILFVPEIPEGTKVQLVRRDEKKISQGAAKMAKRIKKKLGDKQPIAVLHFDCASRGKMFFGDEVKEKAIDVLQNEFSKDVPWLGFFCFGEIAPIKGGNHYHNNTVALCVIYK